ncbi:MAG: DUF3501 family protein [Gammaproteobacteria bacterium]|nr:DUF3501 family protein [Gammaproteobacteria bacterium]MBQ0840319.1 DUF3501 family protein [Gammaproteobacteria bacterium]
MKKLSRQDLWSLEEYSERRTQFRNEVMAHKKHRQVALGDHARLYFEDPTTIRYQVQEMLRIEKIFEGAAIQEELDAYNPLIGDGSNWKATFMLEYTDPEERALALTRLLGIEDKVWVQVGDCAKVFAIADEDMDRANDVKTSAVHFMRFELSVSMVAELKTGAQLQMGIDHPNYPLSAVTVAGPVSESLASDLDAVSIN